MDINHCTFCGTLLKTGVISKTLTKEHHYCSHCASIVDDIYYNRLAQQHNIIPDQSIALTEDDSLEEFTQNIMHALETAKRYGVKAIISNIQGDSYNESTVNIIIKFLK